MSESQAECRECGNSLGAGYLCDDCESKQTNSHAITFRCNHCKTPIETYIEDGIVKSDDYLDCAGESLNTVARVSASGVELLTDHGDVEIVID